MSASGRLFALARELDEYEEINSPELDSLMESAVTIGESWSGSWLGYHSRVYYRDFQVPPPGAVFSQEWGFNEVYSRGTKGEWVECRYDDVYEEIHRRAGNPDISSYVKSGRRASEKFEEVKSLTLSLVHAEHTENQDSFLKSLVDKVDSEKVFKQSDFIAFQSPSGQIRSRDMNAIEKGLVTPPHIAVAADCLATRSPFDSCRNLKKCIIQLASHLQNVESKKMELERVGTNVFIGHGRSPMWRELKDFVDERMKLPWDEFNRIPVAGVTNIARLAQMLDQACIAFLVMTAEDEQADGKTNARMNVIHEVGLFQGRLGFDRAIVLLEEGCEEFSNIQGLGQIRFPEGRISAIFENIRQVLEREGIVD